MQLKLFFSPGSCSRVSMVALEEIGEPFETELVVFMKGDHKAPEYLAMNPAGKVPVLLVDGQPLSQTVAILTFLARSFPQADLLPLGQDALSDAQLLRDLIWCSSDLHPLVTRLRLPAMFCDLPGAPDRVFAMAQVLMTTQLEQAERRLSRQPWMLGERWSMVDAYVQWVWWRITGAGFPAAPFPHLADSVRRTEERPAFQRARAREIAAEQELAAQGALFVPPGRT